MLRRKRQREERAASEALLRTGCTAREVCRDRFDLLLTEIRRRIRRHAHEAVSNDRANVGGIEIRALRQDRAILAHARAQTVSRPAAWGMTVDARRFEQYFALLLFLIEHGFGR